MSDMKEYYDVISELRSKLNQYLLSQGIDISKSLFSCISPDHEDKNPSCSIGGQDTKNPELFHCFSCGVAGDIFHAAHLLENLPLRGAEFFTITLKTLADRFQIPYNPNELDESTKDRLQLISAYRDASDVINGFVVRDWDNEEATYIKMIKERGMTLDTVKEFKIGAIQSKQEYLDAMTSRGWSLSYLRTNELIDDVDKKDKIFETGKIIMTICDKNNNPVAFVSRKHSWSGKEDGAKYVNSSSSIIYKKAETLYGYNLSKNNIKTRTNKQIRPLYIVEGYIDVITLRQAGFKNVAGLGSATFNPEIFRCLSEKSRKEKPFELKDIVLALDGDETGIKNTWKALDDLVKRPDVVVRIKEIPQIKGLSDPDEIVTKNGLKFFKDLRESTPFRWKLQYKKTFNEQPESEFVRSACQDIANEGSPIIRSEMASDLADLTSDFTKPEIMEEVASINNISQAKLEQELHTILDDMYRKKNASRIDIVDLMSETLSRCKSKAKEYKQNKGDVLDVYQQQIKDTEELFRKAGALTGFKLNKYPKLEMALDGFPKDECMISVAAPPNIGKSTWMREISWDIAKSNPNAVVIYMSIDDSSKDVLQALVARECGVARKYVAKFSQNSEDIQDLISMGWDKVKKQKRYIVADSTQGNTLTDLYGHVEYARRNFHDADLIVFLDNFHKLNPGTTSNLREKFVDLSQQIKDLTQIENIPIVMTVEMRKKSGYVNEKTEPKLDDVSESGKMVYDSKLVFLMRQRLHDNLNTQVHWNRNMSEGTLTKMPYLEALIAKNKHSESKTWLGYKFETDKSILRECNYNDIRELGDGQSDQRDPKSNTFNM